jgi:hypothetical protein
VLYDFNLRLSTEAGEALLHPAVRELTRHPSLTVDVSTDRGRVPDGEDLFLATIRAQATDEPLARAGIASVIATSLGDLRYTLELVRRHEDSSAKEA